MKRKRGRPTTKAKYLKLMSIVTECDYHRRALMDSLVKLQKAASKMNTKRRNNGRG